MNKQYSWSSDEERYQGRFDSIEAALDDAADTVENPYGDHVTVYVGEVEPIDVRQLVDVDRIIEGMQEQASDHAGEAAEDYLTGITKEQADELEAMICAWAEKVCPITFWTVTNITTHKIGEDSGN